MFYIFHPRASNIRRKLWHGMIKQSMDLTGSVCLPLDPHLMATLKILSKVIQTKTVLSPLLQYLACNEIGCVSASAGSIHHIDLYELVVIIQWSDFALWPRSGCWWWC